MKVFKSIMLYLLILLGLATAAVLICCVIMICSPNTSIFGYKYISYKNVLEENVSLTSGDYAGINAVSITSNRMDIKILPNVESNENIKIVYSQGMSGFVKKDAVDLQVKLSRNDSQEFESGDSSFSGITYKALCIDVAEPDGIIFLSDCYIKVYLPAKTYAVVNAYTKNGGIDYSSKNEKTTINVSNLYLMSTSRDVSKKAVTVYKPSSSRYYLRTGVGNCFFNNEGEDFNGNIIFETSGGKLVAKNGAIKGSLTVRTSTDVNGATLDITKLYGNLTFVARSGNISIASIEKGSNSAYPVVDIQSKYCSAKIDKLYGTITTQGYEGGDVDNIDITINDLIHQGSSGIDIDSGKGNIVINKLFGDANLVSSTGNITVKNANPQELYVDTHNGYITLAFVDAELRLSKLDIHVSKRSNMNLSNLKGTVNITVDSGESRNINMTFHNKVTDNSEIATVNVISNGDNININNIGSGMFAVYTDGDISCDVAQNMVIREGDADYDRQYNMSSQKRFNYTTPATNHSKIYVHNNNHVNVNQ